MKVAEIDKKFDDGEDVSEFFDMSKASRPNEQRQALSVELPGWLIERLDRRAAHIGVSREALLRIWLAERLEQ